MKRLPDIILIAILIIYSGVTFAISRVTPFNKGPDEETNLAYVEFIAHKGRLPLTYPERELVGKDSNWPPLYHLLLAGLSNGLSIELAGPPQIKIFWDSFRYRAIDAGAEWYYLRTEDQTWPYYGRILVLHLGRWLSILFGVITLSLVYYVVLALLPGRRWLALTAAAILAFLPTYAFISSVMNEDTMMAALATLYLWMLILVIKHPQTWWPYWVMGLALGISVTIKYTTIILPLEVVAVIAVVAWQHGYTWRWWLGRVAVVGGCSVLASSWWFGWNFWFLNEIEERGLVAGLLRPIFTGGPDITLSRLGYFFSGGQIGLAAIPPEREAGAFSEWVSQTFISFWGVGIGGFIPLAPAVYLFVGIIIVLTMLGLWRLWRADQAARVWLALLVFHIAVFFVLPLLRFGLSRRLGETAQGRHILIPAAAAVVGLIVWVLASTIPARWQGWVFSFIVVGMIGWTGAHLHRLNTFEPLPVPLRTLPQAAEWLPDPVHAQFGDVAELVSYNLDSGQDRLALTLAWRSVAPTNESYLLTVNLVDDQGQIVSYWTGYNGHGRLPTLAWDPGDVVFDRLALPLSGVAAGTYRLQIQLTGNGGPVTVSQDKVEAGNILSPVEVSLSEVSDLVFSHRLILAGSDGPLEIPFAIWQADGPAQPGSQPTFRYPATISIVLADIGLDETVLKLSLIDESGQIWPTHQHQVNIDTFVIGPRWPSGEYRLQMALQNGAGETGQATSEPILTVENWWERQFEVPDIAQDLEANFADQLLMLGYKLPNYQVKAGEAFPITIYWQAPPTMAPQADFTQFNHLLDRFGSLRGGYDRRPLEYYNTLLWAPGEVVVDGYTVPVAADAPPGDYYLSVGYYLPVGESAVNLPLVVDGQMTDVSSVTIGPIEVVRP